MSHDRTAVGVQLARLVIEIAAANNSGTILPIMALVACAREMARRLPSEKRILLAEKMRDAADLVECAPVSSSQWLEMNRPLLLQWPHGRRSIGMAADPQQPGGASPPARLHFFQRCEFCGLRRLVCG